MLLALDYLLAAARHIQRSNIGDDLGNSHDDSPTLDILKKDAAIVDRRHTAVAASAEAGAVSTDSPLLEDSDQRLSYSEYHISKNTEIRLLPMSCARRHEHKLKVLARDCVVCATICPGVLLARQFAWPVC